MQIDESSNPQAMRYQGILQVLEDHGVSVKRIANFDDWVAVEVTYQEDQTQAAKVLREQGFVTNSTGNTIEVTETN